jgi:hypothetical protein
MQCILYKIYFWKVFHMYYNLIWIFICTPMWTKNFILVKSGCYKKVTKACDEYFDTHQFDGLYCDCEKNHHHHMTIVRIGVGHRQVFH